MIGEERFLADEKAMVAYGARLACACGNGAVVFLRGDLGSGKTTLVRGILRGLGYMGTVKSPTYTLLEPYLCGDRRVYHFDLYRLADPEELDYIGTRDYFTEEALCLIEWPENGAGFLPHPDLVIHLAYLNSGRGLSFEPHGAIGKLIMRKMID